ncbi:hypothetical protein XA26_00070 [Mycolicibacterium fortuitum]|uniref:Uncharacterized protein n=1 Tax=Mycolicibacterium fortuitum TaxID=1766 RepID=A0A0N9X9H2_MYCFO|nr:hypothetical protein G155_00001 [Mycobacterium sp. VKM Ac-1817D]ALI23876.1 hypothetical protein XA26_00070 [Mycolicibacterium fortuitum]
MFLARWLGLVWSMAVRTRRELRWRAGQMRPRGHSAAVRKVATFTRMNAVCIVGSA